MAAADAAEVIERSAEPAAAGCGELRVKMEEDEAGDEAGEAVVWQAGNDERRQKSGPGRQKTVQDSARGSSLVNEEVWILLLGRS